MGEKPGNTPGRGLQTVLGAGAVIEGTVKINHDIRVDGTVKGKLSVDGDLIVGNTGLIEADIEVVSTKIGGKIIGNLSARERIELEENASITGDIRTKDLVINEGAVFHGNCSMNADAKNGK